MQGAWTISSYGTQCHVHAWPGQAARGTLVIAHGLGEHGGRYAPLADYLNSHGYAVFAIDHPGHGQSPGIRGHISHFDQYCTELDTLISSVRNEYPGHRLHLLGHSLGGFIATDYVVRYSGVDSLILSAPAFETAEPVNRLLRSLSICLASLLPEMTVPSGLNPDYISRDAAVVAAYQQDPLVHNRVSLAMFRAYQREKDFVAKHLGEIRCPTLMLLAGDDRLVSTPAAEAAFAAFGSAEKHLERYEHAYHELFNEADIRQTAFACLRDWLDRHS